MTRRDALAALTMPFLFMSHQKNKAGADFPPMDLFEVLRATGRSSGSGRGLRFFQSFNAAVLGGVIPLGTFTGATWKLDPDEEFLFLYMLWTAQSNNQIIGTTMVGGDLLEWNFHIGPPGVNMLRSETRIPPGVSLGEPAPGPWTHALHRSMDYLGTPGSSIQRLGGWLPIMRTHRGGELQVGMTAWRGYTGAQVWNMVISAVALEL